MSNKIKVKVENLNLYYGENHALKDVEHGYTGKCCDSIYRTIWLR